MSDADTIASEREPGSSESLVGRILQGKYRLIEVIAAGGMGKIYRAEQLPLGRTVALKVVHSQLSGADSITSAESFKKRFLLEASILSKLQHSNIVTVFDYGLIDGFDDTYFMVMEYLSGITLARRINTRPLLTVLEVVFLAEQIAKGLREAHRSGVIHRDLKPANIMVVQEDEGVDKAKILDFGLVKMIETEHATEITGSGEMLGSPRYMSPEQITGGVKVDQQSDIYSFGVVMYEMLTGLPPFDGDTPIQIVVSVLNDQPPPLESASREPLPLEVLALVKRCMSKSPASRPSSMDQVLQELRACRSALGLDTGSLSVGDPSRRDTPSSARKGGPRSVSSIDRERLALAPTVPPESALAGIETVPLPSLSLEMQKVPIEPLGQSSWGPRLAVISAGVLVLGSLVFLVTRGSSTTDDRREGGVPSVLAPPSSSVHEAASFSLRVESTPPGAEVWDEATRLGVTPLSIVLDNDDVRRRPRAFLLKLADHMPLVVQQGPSSQPVVQQVSLSPLPPNGLANPLTPVSSASASVVAAASAPAGTTKAQHPGGSIAAPKPTATATSDIHLTR